MSKIISGVLFVVTTDVLRSSKTYSKVDKTASKSRAITKYDSDEDIADVVEKDDEDKSPPDMDRSENELEMFNEDEEPESDPEESDENSDSDWKTASESPSPVKKSQRIRDGDVAIHDKVCILIASN